MTDHRGPDDERPDERAGERSGERPRERPTGGETRGEGIGAGTDLDGRTGERPGERPTGRQSRQGLALGEGLGGRLDVSFGAGGGVDAGGGAVGDTGGGAGVDRGPGPHLLPAFGARHLGAGGASVALHLLVVAIVIWVGMRPLTSDASADDDDARAGRATRAPLTAFAAPPPESREARSRAAADDDDNGRAFVDGAPPDLGIVVDDEASTLDLNGFTFDLRKLTDRAAALFPFVTRRLTFALPATPPRRESHGLVNPFTPRDGDVRGQPLTMTEAELQAVIDKAWSRRERWKPFQPIAALADFYSPNEGQVPSLLRAYAVQNGLQPYVDPGVRDPRLWAQLGLVADHGHFLDFIGRYAAEHPSTKATTELLFLLDTLAQASLDGLVTLRDIDPARHLRWTRRTHPHAFDALVTIRAHYRAVLERRGLTSPDAIVAFYDELRLALLESISRTTPGGYRSSDARFLIGEIYWRQQKRAAAREIWSEMRPDAQDRYAIAAAAILATLRSSEDPSFDGGYDRARINNILDAERGRWVSFSYDRLHQFGYRFDTF